MVVVLLSLLGSQVPVLGVDQQRNDAECAMIRNITDRGRGLGGRFPREYVTQCSQITRQVVLVPAFIGVSGQVGNSQR